jgi:hypothetical protein
VRASLAAFVVPAESRRAAAWPAPATRVGAAADGARRFVAAVRWQTLARWEMVARSVSRNPLWPVLALVACAESHAEPAETAARADSAAGGYAWLAADDAPPGTAVLTLLDAVCLDNGEGDTCPHGPFGSIYVDFFPQTEPHWPDGLEPPGAKDRCFRRPDDPSRCHRRLPGPHLGEVRCPLSKPSTAEWLDGDTMRYTDGDADAGPALFAWRDGEDGLVMRLWESDPGSFLGRRDDVLGLERVDRAATETAEGLWMDFHAYDSGVPRQPTQDVAFRLRLKTVVR